jgi:hypothetical protein
MPEPKNDEWKRVTDPKIKPHREWNVPADAVVEGLKVLDKPTHYLDGSPIEAKYTPTVCPPSKSDDKSEGASKK